MAGTESVELAVAYVSVVPELDGLSKALRKELANLDMGDAGREAGKSFVKAFDTASSNVSTGALKKTVKDASGTVKKAMGDAEQATKDAEKAQDEYNKTVAKYGRNSDEATQAEKKLTAAKEKAENASKTLETAEQQLGKAQQELSSKAKDNGLDQLGDDLKNLKDNMGSLSGGLSGLAAGLGIAAGVKTAVESGLSQLDIEGTLKAKLGDTQAAKEAAEIAGSVYAEGWGESLEEVGDAAVVLRQQLGTIDDSADFAGLTRQAIALGDTFGHDVGEMANAAGQMIRTGLADNAQDAFDIITAGMQAGDDKAGDLLDTINEYSTQFRKLGFNGETAMGLISQGLQAGARDSDLVADALKELSIRAVDGSDSTIDGFTRLGLSADDMAAAFGKGGKSASDALDTLMDRLRAVEDPVERSQIAVELFGTQAEDLGDALYALDPSTAVDAIGEVGGAAEQATDDARGLEQDWTQLVRTIEKEVGKNLMPVIEEATDFIEQHGDQISDVIGGAADIVGDLVGAFLDLPEPVQLAIGGMALFGGKAKTMVDTIGDIASATKKAGGFVSDLFQNGFGKTSIVDKAGKAVDAAGDAIDAAGGKAKNTSGILGGFGGVGGAFAVAGGVIAAAAWAIGDQMEKDAALSEQFQQAMKDGADSARQFWDALESGNTGELGIFDKIMTGSGTVGQLLDDTGVKFEDFQNAVMGSGKATNRVLQQVTKDTGGLDASVEDFVRKMNVPGPLGMFSKMAALVQHGDLLTMSKQVSQLSDSYKEAVEQMVAYGNTQESITSGFSNAASMFSELNTTLDANGDHLENNGQLTEESSAAIQRATDSLWDSVAAQIAYGKETGNVDEAVQSAKNNIQLMRDSLIDTLVAHGMEQEAAEQTADALGLIPANANTEAVFIADEGKVQAYLDRLGLTPEQKTIVMNALTEKANGDIDSLQMNMDELPGFVEEVLTADNTDALNKTNEATTSVRNFGARRDTATLDANNGAAIGNTNAASGRVSEFGRQNATATVDVRDNASWRLDGILGKLWDIAGNAWSAVVSVFSSGGGSIGRASGGIVGLATGGQPSGMVKGPGTRTSDSIITALSRDEYVINAYSSAKIGYDNLDYMNRTGEIPAGIGYESRAVNTRPDKADPMGVTPDMLENAVYNAIRRVDHVGLRLDSGVMAGELAPALDKELGRRTLRGLA